MVSSSLSLSPSSLNKSKKMRIFLDALPEDLLVEICSRTGASSLSAVCNLRAVSKHFRRICDDPYVISRLSLQEVRFSPWGSKTLSYRRSVNFIKRCRENGNPEALYREGFLSYFVDNREPEGLELLAEAAEKGSKEAKYLHGLILICLGGETKQKGFEILSSFIKPSKSTTAEELMELRRKTGKVINDFWCDCKSVIERLKKSYVREKCECDFETKRYRVRGKDCGWHYGFCEFCLPACQFCLWDEVVRGILH